jgi:hypothetical protein
MTSKAIIIPKWALIIIWWTHWEMMKRMSSNLMCLIVEVLYAYKTYLNGKTVVHLYLQIWFTHRSRQDTDKTEVVNIYSHNIWDPTFVK